MLKSWWDCSDLLRLLLPGLTAKADQVAFLKGIGHDQESGLMDHQLLLGFRNPVCEVHRSSRI
jgi:hypothetical protein